MAELKKLAEKDYKEFFEWLLERNVELNKEPDNTLNSIVDIPYIWYPNEIMEFLKTRPMQRLKKIEQLGTNILAHVDACHTRYAHSLGTYHNAVVFYIFQFEDEQWKKRIEQSGRKVEVLADIMEALRHDDGHNILSHGLEKLIGNAKGTHEVVGARFKNELEESRVALTNIHPNLIEAMKKVSSPDYDLITLREGNLDFDRLDFISRDSLYLGLPDKKGLAHELLRRSHILRLSSDGRDREMVVYDYEALPYIEEFIETRAYLYKNMIASNQIKALDSLEEEFCRIFVDSDVTSGKRLKQYLIHCRENNATTIDLEQFLSWDDLKYYNELIDIAIHAEDEHVRDIAIECLPSKEGLCSLAIEMLNPNNIKQSDYTSEELLFIRNVKFILEKSHPLNKALEADKVRTSVSVLNARTFTDVENVLQNLREQGITEEELSSITTWCTRVKKYNFNEPIFVRDRSGNIFPLPHHPELSINLDSIYISGAMILPAKMRRLGIPENKIVLMQEEFRRFNDQHPEERVPVDRRMRKFQEGESYYIPTYKPVDKDERCIGE